MGRTPVGLRHGWVIGDRSGVQTTSLVFAGLILFFFVVPLLRAVLQAWVERDPWAPFADRPNGRSGILVSRPSFQALRAPRGSGRTTARLVARWAFWVGVTLAMVAGAVRALLTPGESSL